MKIAITSDWHLGYLWGDPKLEMDSFTHLSEAFSIMKEEKVDLVLVSGDLFDKQTPVPEVFYEAINLFNKVIIENKLNLKTDEQILKIPMIGIPGNHEYRGKGYKSTIELLEIMGFIKYLHGDSITINNVSVFGLSGIPDKYALDVLKKWNPTPIPNNYNILLIHQSFREYLPFDDESILTLGNLPGGFDLIVNGHLHWKAFEKLEQGGAFIMPGSTIATQNKKIESDTPKGFYILDTTSKELKFIELKETRPVIYIDLSFKKSNPKDIEAKVNEELEKIKLKEHKKDPFVRIRIKGDLESGFFSKDIDLKKFEIIYPNFYLSFANNIEEKSLKESIDKLKELEKNRGNIEEITKEIFIEQIKQTKVSPDFDYQTIYELLEKGDIEKAKALIFKKPST
ncbi:MAG: metallophosphoesterase [archaeon]